MNFQNSRNKKKKISGEKAQPLRYHHYFELEALTDLAHTPELLADLPQSSSWFCKVTEQYQFANLRAGTKFQSQIRKKFILCPNFGTQWLQNIKFCNSWHQQLPVHILSTLLAKLEEQIIEHDITM